MREKDVTGLGGAGGQAPLVEYEFDGDIEIKIVRCPFCKEILLKDYGNYGSSISTFDCPHFVWRSWGNYCFGCAGDTRACPIDANPKLCRKSFLSKLWVAGGGTTYYTLHYKNLDYDEERNLLRCLKCRKILLKDYGYDVEKRDCHHFRWRKFSNYCYYCAGSSSSCPFDRNPKKCRDVFESAVWMLCKGLVCYTLHESRVAE